MLALGGGFSLCYAPAFLLDYTKKPPLGGFCYIKRHIRGMVRAERDVPKSTILAASR